jgi:hypothetical protein
MLLSALAKGKRKRVKFYDTLYDTILFQKTKMISVIGFTFQLSNW